jgi:hypothetical protein
MKNNKGITLVALVVTIIVLLILAGVTIAMLTGNSGILTQANNAKVTDIEGKVDEDVKLALATARLKIANESALDNSYSAISKFADTSKGIQKVIADDLKNYSSDFTVDTALGTSNTFKITYSGQDYKNATNDSSATIVYTVTVDQYGVSCKIGRNTDGKTVTYNDLSKVK